MDCSSVSSGISLLVERWLDLLLHSQSQAFDSSFQHASDPQEQQIHHHALSGRNLGLPFVVRPGIVVLLPVPIAAISEGLQPHPVVLFHALLPEGSIMKPIALPTVPQLGENTYQIGVTVDIRDRLLSPSGPTTMRTHESFNVRRSLVPNCLT